MIIVGAKGFAKEVFEVVFKSNLSNNIVFYDDINLDENKIIFQKYKILQSLAEAKLYFENEDDKFTIGIGKPILREKIFHKFTQIGGKLTSTISLDSKVGTHDVIIGSGTNILNGAIISNSVTIGIGCIIYYNSIITHDCEVGDFVEISPSATLLGRVKVGDYSQIGANATVLPDIVIGKNVIVGAGSVITKDVPDNRVVVGIPAKIIRELEPIE